MTRHFHGALNRMTIFTTLLVVGLVYFGAEFLEISSANIWLNGVIIGTTLFGIGLCFVQMFQLLPEYKWLFEYTYGRRKIDLPPRLLRPVAQMLSTRPRRISATTLNGLMDTILLRFEDSRESVRYVTNTLIFLGLLGTFWGLILTVGGFADLIGNLDFSDETVLNNMQIGLSRPLAGMATAFTSSLLGLGGSLVIGFLGIQVQFAQNAIFRELEDYLSAHTHAVSTEDIATVLPQINLATRELTRTIQNVSDSLNE
ncbi:MAG: hypothetical protein IKL37_04945 [Alphaproteobacteria bacterium]|nr:hypothetical protein [Alphaproteobacteria bacterium]MBR6685576.1 hypothetical protein [Alphaproteobacteria bacterium]